MSRTAMLSVCSNEVKIQAAERMDILILNRSGSWGNGIELWGIMAFMALERSQTGRNSLSSSSRTFTTSDNFSAFMSFFSRPSIFFSM